MQKKLTIGPYLAKNPFLYFYLRCIDFLFSVLNFFYINPKKPHWSPEKILVIQLAHKGDVIIGTSVLPLIKKKYPKASIGILVGSSSKEIIQNHPLINFVHVFDHPKLNRFTSSFIKKLRLSIRQFRQLIQELKKHEYTITIDLSCYYPNSHFLTWASKIPRRIGYKSGGGSPLLTDSIQWNYERKHMSLYHLDLLKCLNISSNRTDYLKNHLPQYTQISFEELKMRYQIKQPFLIFHPYSGNPLKHWTENKWRLLAESFVKSAYTIIFTGGSEKERSSIENLIRGLDNTLNLANNLSFEELKILVLSSSTVVSVDTMIGHLAATYNIPTITLFSGIADPLQWKPSSKKNISLNTPTNCFPCFKKNGCSFMNCIKEISVEDVLEHLKPLL